MDELVKLAQGHFDDPTLPTRKFDTVEIYQAAEQIRVSITSTDYNFPTPRPCCTSARRFAPWRSLWIDSRSRLPRPNGERTPSRNDPPW